MRTLMIVAILAVSLFVSGCGETSDNDGTNIDYDNPNLTGGLIYLPDHLVFSDNTVQSFTFTYNRELMLPTGVDSTLVDGVYNVSFDVATCMTSVAFGGTCTIDIKFSNPAYVCTDTTNKILVLKFRYLHDFGTGYVKDQFLPIRCVTK